MEQFYDLKENQPEPDLATIRAVEGTDNASSTLISPSDLFLCSLAFLVIKHGGSIDYLYPCLCVEQNDGEQDDGYAVHPKVPCRAIYVVEMSFSLVGVTFCCRLS